jgi:hypothetical protein
MCVLISARGAGHLRRGRAVATSKVDSGPFWQLRLAVKGVGEPRGARRGFRLIMRRDAAPRPALMLSRAARRQPGKLWNFVQPARIFPDFTANLRSVQTASFKGINQSIAGLRYTLHMTSLRTKYPSLCYDIQPAVSYVWLS